MLKFETRSPDAIRKSVSGARDHFLLADSPAELADYAEAHVALDRKNARTAKFAGDDDFATVARKMRVGDLGASTASDALLEKMEAFALPTSRRIVRDDVVGAFPNVPAFIAGHPMSMRRKTRDGSTNAPIAIIADVTVSYDITTRQIQARGAAILALVRALASHRPVELWAVCGMDAFDNKAVWIGTHIETAPLDLAIAAHVLTAPGFIRRICFGIADTQYNYKGRWPYDWNGKHRDHMAAIMAPAFAHVAETLCIPGAHSHDKLVTNPEAWLADQIAKHMPQELGA